MKLYRIASVKAGICSQLGLATLTSCLAIHGATLPTGFTETATAATAVSSPTAFAIAPDGRIFICEQGGAVRVIKNGALLSTPFATFSVDSIGERGLLGVAFDPSFATNQYVYFHYTVNYAPKHNRVVRVTANGDGMQSGTETPIFIMNNLSAATNHNGGAIHFGADGKLYIAVGENATPTYAQSLGNLLGKILRVNPDGSIPTDNPFYQSATGDNRAIWAYGLRNPYTFAVQPGTGRILINDVGQGSFEEINDGIAGSNYGWPVAEGFGGSPTYRDPLLAYGHGAGASTGCAISGGDFYNPPSVNFPASYVGKYFYADFCSGWIRLFDLTTNTATAFASGISYPVDIRTGSDGSLYYLSRGDGKVMRVTYTGSATSGVRGDFDSDSKSDLVWVNESTRQAGVWYMGGSGGNQFQSFSWLTQTGSPGWTVAATADLDGNGKPDLIWQNDTTRQVVAWYMGGTKGDQYQNWAWLQSSETPGWRVVAAADLDGNGKPELIWQNDTTRQVAAWYMAGAMGNQFQSFRWLDGTGTPGWRVAAVTDLDGGGKHDLIWQNDTTGQVVAWYMGGSMGDQYQSYLWLQNSNTPGWRVVGAADLDGNGRPDLLWQEESTRKVAVWYMSGTNGNQFLSFAWVESNGIPGWRAIGVR